MIVITRKIIRLEDDFVSQNLISYLVRSVAILLLLTNDPN